MTQSETRPRLRVLSALAALAALGLTALPLGRQAGLGTPEAIAPGVEFFTTTDQTLVAGAGPIAAYLLRLDPERVRLESAHAHDEVFGVETVDSIAARHHAVAAINGGFFNRQNGDPMAALKIAGELVSDAPRVKGAVIIRSPPEGRTELDFDQVGARVRLRAAAGGREWLIPVDGVDTTRARGKLMLYTASYHAHSDTAPTGTEWSLSGRPLTVTAVRPRAGHTAIPRDGVVLSFGGFDPPAPLAALVPGVQVSLETTWTSTAGVPASRFDEADSIVNGAGLLRVHGRALTDWSAESLSAANFIDMRHPRTLIGVDSHGAIWLAAIDGRQPGSSIGMTFADLQRLCDRLDLRDALNLDGGGSTTMVVKDRIVNRPSDVTGAREVSDAILVTRR